MSASKDRAARVRRISELLARARELSQRPLGVPVDPVAYLAFLEHKAAVFAELAQQCPGNGAYRDAAESAARDLAQERARLGRAAGGGL